MRTLLRIDLDLDLPDSIKKGDTIQFIFDYNKFYLVIPLEDNRAEDLKKERKRIDDFYNKYPKNYMNYKDLHMIYHNKLVDGTFDSFSRIDKYPIIEFELNRSQFRDKRIDVVLDEEV